MKLMTKEVLEALKPMDFYAQAKPEDIICPVKFFATFSSWRFYPYEYDPESRIFFGMVDGDYAELGTFSLDEIESVKGPLGLGFERDLHWTPTPLTELKLEGIGGNMWATG